MTDKTVVIIGGGPAGMIACGRLKERVGHVVLIDKNKFLGRKLRITGKGRCNITNTADIEDIMQNIPTNSTFLYSALYSFTNDDAVALINSLGVETKVERGGRVFPKSDNANDVADALKRYALGKNVKLIRELATDILTENGRVVGVKTLSGKIDADSVIIATGGASYPLTGSNGDGYRMAEQLGHTVITPKASLVPIETKERWVAELMGLSLKNVGLTLLNENGKAVYTDFGEMLFTHFGVSGPIVLSASCHLSRAGSNAVISLDLKPALDLKQLDARILRDFEKFNKKHLQNSLDELLPKAIIPVIIKRAALDPHKEVCNITRAERLKLGETIKALTLEVKGTRPVSEAIVTSGGVKVSEINPSTMESKMVDGLYFAGEVIDVDAYTGGFNLQIAYSTGFLAGENA